MHEIDLLSVGDGDRSGLAIAMRFTRADTGDLAHVIIDGGFQDDGDDLVRHVRRYYGTSHVDVVVLTHPDGDHIGGLGAVFRSLDVDYLVAHRLSTHGGTSLPASDQLESLISVATANGADFCEPFAALNFFDAGLAIAGPDEAYYEELVQEQVAEQSAKAVAKRGPTALSEALAKVGAGVMGMMPVEVPFEDAGGTNPRNNSSAIVDIRTADGRRMLFTGDAGVPALNEALDRLDAWGRTDRNPDFIQVPHHGSRKNASSTLLDRMLGPKTDVRDRTAYISISEKAAQDPRYPSPRICNAYARRGYSVYETRGRSLVHSENGVARDGWGPADPIPALDESIDNR